MMIIEEEENLSTTLIISTIVTDLRFSKLIA
jgi:hypothetical protein